MTKQKTCILYYGFEVTIPERIADISGDGTCLDLFTPDGGYKSCREAIAALTCPKKRKTWLED